MFKSSSSVIFVLASVVQLVVSQNHAFCSFSLTPLGNYVCDFVNQNIQNEGNLQGSTGDHIQGWSDEHVGTISQRNSVINIFPSLFINRFINLTVVVLANTQMQQFASPLTNCAHLFIIYLDNNQITSIPGRGFINCERLSLLSIANNRIEDIQPDAFLGLSNLNGLNLQGNNIATLDPNLFSSVSRLNLLQLARNRISDLSHSLFQFMPNLANLHLDNNLITSWNGSILASNFQLTEILLRGNQIEDINANSFENLPNLVTLTIGSNIRNIPTLVNPGNLRNLTLSINPIVQVSAASFRYLRTLERLFLDACLIETADFALGTENFLPQLKLLSLSGNRITNLQANAFSMLIRLETLRLSGNQIQRLNANSIRPIVQMRVLDVSSNRINRIERELFVGVTNLNFRATGNPCANRNVIIQNNEQFEREIAPQFQTCFTGFAVTTKINAMLVVLSASFAMYMKF